MENPVSDDSLAGRTSIRQTISHVNSQSRYVFYFKSNIFPTLRYGEVSQLHYVLRTYCCGAQAEGKALSRQSRRAIR